jgi:ABC-type phosphate/phosphonate transport system substrate-binding protein
MMRSNSLPMYDFPEVQTSTKAILDALSEAFTKLGDASQASFPESSIHAHLMQMWKDDATLFSQSCGLPFVEDLHDYVDIVATLKWTGISDERGWYRTVIVARGELGVASLGEVGGMQPVITNQQSLSGWCSLGVALSNIGADASYVLPYVESEGHAKSLQFLQDKRADFASIDPGTFQLLQRHRPSLTNGLRIIGHGPHVPATPMHVSKVRTADFGVLQAAVLEVFSRAELAGARAEIGIDGAVAISASDYSLIPGLVAQANAVLPRR